MTDKKINETEISIALSVLDAIYFKIKIIDTRGFDSIAELYENSNNMMAVNRVKRLIEEISENDR